MRLWKGKRVETPLGPAEVINPDWLPRHDRRGHKDEAAVAVKLDRGGHRIYRVRELREPEHE